MVSGQKSLLRHRIQPSSEKITIDSVEVVVAEEDAVAKPEKGAITVATRAISLVPVGYLGE